jgi:hypothetical protein
MSKSCKHCGIQHDIKGYSCRVCKDGLYRYGMTRLDQIQLHDDQNKKCFLCETEVELFVGHKGGFVDHDHKTGKVRGILCNRCNTVVGGLESHTNVKKLLEYIKIGA